MTATDDGDDLAAAVRELRAEIAGLRAEVTHLRAGSGFVNYFPAPAPGGAFIPPVVTYCGEFHTGYATTQAAAPVPQTQTFTFGGY